MPCSNMSAVKTNKRPMIDRALFIVHLVIPMSTYQDNDRQKNSGEQLEQPAPGLLRAGHLT